MAELKNFNGHFCESEYEYAFIDFLESEGWTYSPGNNVPRRNKNKLIPFSSTFF